MKSGVGKYPIIVDVWPNFFFLKGFDDVFSGARRDNLSLTSKQLQTTTIQESSKLLMDKNKSPYVFSLNIMFNSTELQKWLKKLLLPLC